MTLRRVLLVSPHFPPVNAADMHRIRLLLPHFREFGWEAEVLAVRPHRVEAPWDPRLQDTLPADVPVHLVNALPTRWTRKVGLGNLGFRALPFLFLRGCWLLMRRRFDLVYFSTTMFPVFMLGRLWRRLFKVPFVFDMQDPWYNTYYEDHPQARPRKYRFMNRMNRIMEPWAMRGVSALIAVSDAYPRTLRERYPWLRNVPAHTLEFGASFGDFAHLPPRPAGANPQEVLCGRYVGRGGPDMRRAAHLLFSALALGRQRHPALFSRVQLEFIGTDYAPSGQGKQTLRPVAQELGVADQVQESPDRVPYFDALALLHSADFLIMLGSDDPGYSGSKLYPYLLARRPLLVLCHAAGSWVGILQQTGGARWVTFDAATDSGAKVAQVSQAWEQLLEDLPGGPELDEAGFAPLTARDLCRRHCEIFTAVVEDGNSGF
ncbi:MAG: glycosyltransferase [Magnetococcus sp. WYHC-3]